MDTHTRARTHSRTHAHTHTTYLSCAFKLNYVFNMLQVRNNCFHVDNMKQLFQDIHVDSIMTFLRQINLFNKI